MRDGRVDVVVVHGIGGEQCSPALEHLFGACFARKSELLVRHEQSASHCDRQEYVS